MARQGGYAGMLIASSVLIGMGGYHWIAGFAWIDSFLNACMLLGGMGPVGELTGNGAKLFAGIFALYSGLVFLIAAWLLLAPMFHRGIHRFCWGSSKHESKA